MFSVDYQRLDKLSIRNTHLKVDEKFLEKLIKYSSFFLTVYLIYIYTHTQTNTS